MHSSTSAVPERSTTPNARARTWGDTRVRRLAAMAAALVLVSACSSGDTIDGRDGTSSRRDTGNDPDAPTTSPDDGSPSTTDQGSASSAIEWDDCGGLQCGELEVPRDHFGDEPNDTITLALAMRPAEKPDERVGAILLNPGGPGAAGRDLPEALESQFPDEVLDRFDLVGWDPRGTGASTAVDCGEDLDGFFATDKSPDTAAEEADNVEAAERFAADCAAKHGDLLPFLSTTQTVEDMDAIRAALGDDGLTYLGFSYGTYLGVRYAEAHPERVRALVLDGPVDPSLEPAATTTQQSIGFERALEAFFAWCEEDECEFSPADPRDGFRRLMAQIDAERLYADAGGSERGLGPGEADLGVAVALYSGDAAYEFLAKALAEAAQGDGSQLLEFADLYTGRIDDNDYDGSMAAFYAIGCVDSLRPTLDSVRDLGDDLTADAPFLGAANAWLGLPCVYWPVEPDPAAAPRRIEVAAGTPILVTATDGDPATPIEWAEGLAEQLAAPLLVAESNQHTAFGAGDSCVDALIVEFLVDPERAETEC